MQGTFRILITTDNHVGYNEIDPIRGQDSAKTFHEIMTLAKDQDVDMVLQGGDLFHINKPSRESMYQVIKTLRMTCLGDKPCEMENLNHGQLGVEENVFDYVNYEDPNINISLPVFAISGNHDDSGGASMLSPMDVLSATGLINHFGRVSENDKITVSPVLLRKGTTKLALYGLASVRDERLYRTFKSQNVKFLRPNEDASEWFNMLAVHQNHISHSEKNYLPESFLPDFMDTVIWGHEHECLLDNPLTNPDQGFTVLQPGSSIATSLSEAEAVDKQVCILSITGKDWSIERFPLKTVRPFKMETVYLSADSFIEPGSDSKSEVSKWMIRKVDKLIEQANDDWKKKQNTAEGEEPPLPLIRLRVEYSGGYEVENPTRFSNLFVGKVANVNDVVQYFKKKAPTKRPSKKRGEVTDRDPQQQQQQDDFTLDNLKVRKLVEEYLSQQSLDILQENGLGDAISQFVDKDDKAAVKSFVDDSLATQMKNLLHLGEIDEKDLLNAINSTKSLPIEKNSVETQQQDQKPTTSSNQRKTTTSNKQPKKKQPTAAKNKKPTTAKKNPPKSSEMIEDSEDESVPAPVDEIDDSGSEFDITSPPSPPPQPKKQQTKRSSTKKKHQPAPVPQTSEPMAIVS